METHFFPWEPAQDLVINYEFLQKKKSYISQLLFVAQHERQNSHNHPQPGLTLTIET